MRTPAIVRVLRDWRVRADRRRLWHVKSALQKAKFKAGGSSWKRGRESSVQMVEGRAHLDDDEVGTTTSTDPSNGW